MYQSQILIEQEFELATTVRDLLKPFLFVTKQLSQESITRIDLVINSSLYLRHKISSFTYASELTKNVKCLLLNSLNFYLDKYEILNNPLLISAAFLNPNYKSFQYSTEVEKNKFLDLSKNFLIKIWQTINTKEDLKENKANEQSDPLSAASNASFWNENVNDDKEYDPKSIESEIVQYAADSYVTELSKYWCLRKTVYPILFKLARVILSCPGTSVSSERVFSNASDQLWAKRNRLSADTFEKLMVIYSSLKI